MQTFSLREDLPPAPCLTAVGRATICRCASNVMSSTLAHMYMYSGDVASMPLALLSKRWTHQSTPTVLFLANFACCAESLRPPGCPAVCQGTLLLLTGSIKRCCVQGIQLQRGCGSLPWASRGRFAAMVLQLVYRFLSCTSPSSSDSPSVGGDQRCVVAKSLVWQAFVAVRSTPKTSYK